MSSSFVAACELADADVYAFLSSREQLALCPTELAEHRLSEESDLARVRSSIQGVMCCLFFCWTASQGVTLSKEKVSHRSQQGHVRDAEGRSAGRPLTLTSRRVQRKSQRQGQYIAPGQTRFTWEPQSVTVQSDSLAGLTNPRFLTRSAPSCLP